MVDANGNTTRFIHNLTNDTEVVIDRMGRTNTAVYDTRGNVTATTNALNQVVLMAYDGNNNKTNQVVFANGQPYATNNFAYDPATLLLTAATDPLGHTSSFAYNSFGQLTQSTDANNNPTLNFYDPNTGDFLGTSDALGDATTNFYSGGLLIGSRDEAGTLTTNVYDRFRKPDHECGVERFGNHFEFKRVCLRCQRQPDQLDGVAQGGCFMGGSDHDFHLRRAKSHRADHRAGRQHERRGFRSDRKTIVNPRQARSGDELHLRF